MFVVKETSNPITDATQGIDGLKIDHVAIYHHTDSADYALEAIGKGVVLTPLTAFLNRTKGKEGKPLVAVGRVIVDCDMNTSICLTIKKSIVANWSKSRLSTIMDFRYSPLFPCHSTIKTERY